MIQSCKIYNKNHFQELSKKFAILFQKQINKIIKYNKENFRNFHSKKNALNLKIQLIKLIRISNNKMICNINKILIDYLQLQKMINYTNNI